MENITIGAEAPAARSYEELRMEKLRRNQEIMRTLGLVDTVQTLDKLASSGKKPPRSTGRKRISALSDDGDSTTPSGPRRRSPRLMADGTPGKINVPSTDDVESPVHEVEDEEQHPFDPSKVLMYTCDEKQSSVPSDGKSLRQLKSYAVDPALKRMYSLNFHAERPLIVGGGHQGRVALFSAKCSSQQAEEDIILSFRASSGWISGVRFLKASECSLVVTSNDGSLSLWDCTVQRKLEPRRIFSEQIHGKSGIFDLDLIGNDFVTSSKDGSLCVGVIGESKPEVSRRYADAHSGVAKSVMFRPDGATSTLASGGNDAVVRVWDARASDNKPTVELESAFNIVLNVVKWNPANDNTLLAASFAPSIEVFDIRKPGEPALQLRGHLPVNCNRSSNIYQPVYVHGGAHVVASGGGSKNLTLFDARTGDVVSSGFVGWEAGALEVSSNGANRLAVSHGSEISFFE